MMVVNSHEEEVVFSFFSFFYQLAAAVLGLELGVDPSSMRNLRGAVCCLLTDSISRAGGQG